MIFEFPKKKKKTHARSLAFKTKILSKKNKGEGFEKDTLDGGWRINHYDEDVPAPDHVHPSTPTHAVAGTHSHHEEKNRMSWRGYDENAVDSDYALDGVGEDGTYSRYEGNYPAPDWYRIYLLLRGDCRKSGVEGGACVVGRLVEGGKFLWMEGGIVGARWCSRLVAGRWLPLTSCYTCWIEDLDNLAL